MTPQEQFEILLKYLGFNKCTDGLTVDIYIPLDCIIQTIYLNSIFSHVVVYQVNQNKNYYQHIVKNLKNRNKHWHKYIDNFEKYQQNWEGKE